MKNSQASDSAELSSFERLDPRIQRWIWNSGWTELRDAQNRAIPLILDGSGDLIIAASTASGKTEAAFFPILTRLASDPAGIVLYISPLKALINDQWRRLDELCELLAIPVTPWHGDIGQQRKARFLKRPQGCLLITPESVEAMVMRRGHGLAGLLAGLRFIVVDEMHAFIGTERGKQLQSLLHRIEKAVGRRILRIGLSATLGDLCGAAEFLRPGRGNQVAIIDSKHSGQELKVLVKGVEQRAATGSEDTGEAARAVARDLFDCLRGSSNLVFPNSRSSVEFYADSLRSMCEERGVPNEFWPHHGNLSKEIREEAEAALKQTERPANAICTSTLELGIDIGPVRSVIQVGPPPSVSSLRQRLGRSGRRPGEPMILRAYAIEDELTAQSGISAMLREGMIATTAMIRLLAKGWYEPLQAKKLHASTLVQQVLSSLAQYGGAHAEGLWELLARTGPFSAVSSEQFLSLLKKLGEEEIIFQDPTGVLLLAPKGERITGHYSFFAAFTTDEEFRILSHGRTLGSMPISRPLSPETFIIFAGRRWQVVSVSQEEKVVEVEPAKGGSLPGFEGAMGATVEDRVREEMRTILRSNEAIPFLDRQGQQFLREARANYKRLGLERNWLLETGNEVSLLLWRADRVHDTLLLMLEERGLHGANEGLAVVLKDTTGEVVRGTIAQILRESAPDPVLLARSVLNKSREKWDDVLPANLLQASFASANLDVPATLGALETLMEP